MRFFRLRGAIVSPWLRTKGCWMQVTNLGGGPCPRKGEGFSIFSDVLHRANRVEPLGEGD